MNAAELTSFAGVSTCLSVWIMHLLEFAPPRVKVAQFNLTIGKGSRYLQPASRVLAVSIMTLLYLAYVTPSSGWGFKCTVYAIALVMLVPVAPYEIYLIFPINDRVAELGTKMEKEGTDDNEAIDKELIMLLRKWRFRNWGRAGPCLATGILLAFAGSPLVTG